MEFSSARSSRKRTEETLPWAKASQHSVSNCATKQPSVWMKSGEKKSDMSCAGNRKASLRSSSSGRQPPKAKGKGQVISRKPGSHSSIADATTFSSLLTKQRRGMSRAAAHLSHLFREPAAWICFLLFCPTTCLLLEKQPRAAKNLQSSKSQNND